MSYNPPTPPQGNTSPQGNAPLWPTPPSGYQSSYAPPPGPPPGQPPMPRSASPSNPISHGVPLTPLNQASGLPPPQYGPPNYPPPSQSPSGHDQFGPSSNPSFPQAPLPAQYQQPYDSSLQPGFHPPPGQANIYAAPPFHPLYLGTPIPAYQVQASAPPGAIGYKEEAEKIRKATKGFGTDDKAVIKVLAPLNAIQMDEFARVYQASYGSNLVELLKKEASGYFEKVLVGLAQGPLLWDVFLLEQARSGLGTKEVLLTEILMDRTNAEINILGEVYRRLYNRTLQQVVSGELSLDTANLFGMAIAANRDESDLYGPPGAATVLNTEQIAKDVKFITSYSSSSDPAPFCSIIVNSSRAHLSAVAYAVLNAKKKSLIRIIESKFSGHMEKALVYIVEGATASPGLNGRPWNGVQRDADLIYAAMEGFGTKDDQLIWRIVRNHWNTPRFEAIKEAFLHKKGKSLASKVKSETSGSYRDALLAIIGD